MNKASIFISILLALLAAIMILGQNVEYTPQDHIKNIGGSASQSPDQEPLTPVLLLGLLSVMVIGILSFTLFPRD